MFSTSATERSWSIQLCVAELWIFRHMTIWSYWCFPSCIWMAGSYRWAFRKPAARHPNAFCASSLNRIHFSSLYSFYPHQTLKGKNNYYAHPAFPETLACALAGPNLAVTSAMWKIITGCCCQEGLTLQSSQEIIRRGRMSYALGNHDPMLEKNHRFANSGRTEFHSKRHHPAELAVGFSMGSTEIWRTFSRHKASTQNLGKVMSPALHPAWTNGFGWYLSSY